MPGDTLVWCMPCTLHVSLSFRRATSQFTRDFRASYARTRVHVRAHTRARTHAYMHLRWREAQLLLRCAHSYWGMRTAYILYVTVITRSRFENFRSHTLTRR